jgi:hypothetical protein
MMKIAIAPIMGTLRLIGNLVWASISIAALFYGDALLQSAQEATAQSFQFGNEILQTTYNLLLETQSALHITEESLEDMQEAATNTAIALADTHPLIDEAAQVITRDVPEAVEETQASMPSLVETASAVDDALRLLSAFHLTIPNPFGDDWELGLGVSYNPETPLDQSLAALSDSLDEIPADLRDIEGDLNAISENILVLRDDLAVLADDLYALNQQISSLEPQIETLADDVLTAQAALNISSARLEAAFPTIHLVYIAFWGLILLEQIPSAYQGITMFYAGRREGAVAPSGDANDDV